MDSPLSDYFRAQAAWRERKAEVYPEDTRNAQSAAALRSVAEFVADDDAGYAGALAPFLFENVSLGGEETRRAVARYGYGYAVSIGLGQHEEFLEELITLCVKDAYEHAGGAGVGADPSGTLFEFEIDAAKDGVNLGPGYFKRRARSTEGELEDWVREARAAEDDGEAA